MTSNIKIEDRIASKLKSEEFGQFFSDEDIYDLTKRAIDIAFFQNRPGDHYNSGPKPPLIVEYAQQNLKAIMAEQVKKVIVEKIAAEPDTLNEIMAEVIKASLADLALEAFKTAMRTQFDNMQFSIQENIRQMFTAR